MDGYEKNRYWHGDHSGSQVVVAATGDTVLRVCKTDHTIYVQHLRIQLTTGSSGKTWSIEDTADTPVSITGALPVDTAPASFEVDFGADGIPLTAGKNLNLNVSAAGAAGVVTWSAYQKPIAVRSL